MKNYPMLPSLLLAAVVVTAAPLPAQTPSLVAKAAETITAADVIRHISVIADDSMMGRTTPSPGIEATGRYVADQFKKFGLKPGGDNGTWFQRYQVAKDTATAPNTIGIIEGSDAKLKAEYIVFIAHMDAQGFATGQQPDSIKNGADDNASGTAAIVELAKAFSQSGARPRRSLMFITFSGEEKIGLGSKYFVAHPTVPLQQLAASINLDMIGRNAPDSIKVLGTLDSDLGAIVTRVSAAHPELPMTPVPAGSAFSFESDHFFFAEKGVPVLYFKNGSHPDYHRVSDSPEKIDAEKVARVARLVFFVGQEAANAEQRPQWGEEARKRIKPE